MNVDEYVEKLELQKNDIGFYKCPFCDYTNADAKVVRKHVKSKHLEEIEKELKKLESQKSKNNGKNKLARKNRAKVKSSQRGLGKRVLVLKREKIMFYSFAIIIRLGCIWLMVKCWRANAVVRTLILSWLMLEREMLLL